MKISMLLFSIKVNLTLLKCEQTLFALYLRFVMKTILH